MSLGGFDEGDGTKVIDALLAGGTAARARAGCEHDGVDVADGVGQLVGGRVLKVDQHRLAAHRLDVDELILLAHQ
jgi:hypothetical protein